MTSKEMLKAKCPKGYWFKNIAPLGKKPNWILVKKQLSTNRPSAGERWGV